MKCLWNINTQLFLFDNSLEILYDILENKSDDNSDKNWRRKI